MLTLLAPELLGLILDLVNAEDIFNLWLCGSRELNHTCAERGGIRSFTLVRPRFVIPSLIFKLTSLQALRLSYDCDIVPFKIIQLHLDHLPSGLLELSLLFDPGINSASQKTLPPYPFHTRFPRLRELSFVGDIGFSDEILNNIPPTLTSLEITGSSLTEDFVSHLPPNITALSLFHGIRRLAQTKDHADLKFPDTLKSYTSNGIDQASILRHIPGSITSLNLGDVIPNDFEKYCPNMTNLKEFNFKIPFGKKLTAEHISFLPRSLTKINFYDAWFQSNFETTKEHIEALPPLLTELELISDQMTDEMINNLPKHLTSLRIDTPLQSSLTPNSIKLLPHGLSHLSIKDLDIPSVEIAMALSRSLTFLQVREIALEAFPFLPPRISELNFSTHKFKASDRVSRLLPPNLNTLVAPSSILTENGLNDLPNSLLDLYLAKPIFPEDSCTMQTDSASSLPKYLRTLICYEFPVSCDAEYLTNLPTSLTELNLWAPKLNSTCFKLLPKTLKRLHLKLESVIHGTHFINLPRRLLYLVLVAPHCSLCDYQIVNMPPRLIRVLLPYCPGLTKTGMKEIMKKVRFVDMASKGSGSLSK